MAIEKAIIGGGCFWCVEAVYSMTKGVSSAISGYAGGARPNPSYEQICTGATGHAEVVEITYDSDVISYGELLKIFFVIHDPTTLNQQGGDRGTQYRSVIFYLNEEQEESALAVMKELSNDFRDKIVTELSEAPTFYKAEDYHQLYFKKNPNQGYCQAVVRPKVQKFMQNFTKLISVSH